MNINRINVEDRVAVIENGNLRKGTVETLYSDYKVNACRVHFDDGEIEKVELNRLAKLPKEEPEEDEAEDASSDEGIKATDFKSAVSFSRKTLSMKWKPEVTIKSEEFEIASREAIREILKEHPSLGVNFIRHASELSVMLMMGFFLDLPEDDE